MPRSFWGWASLWCAIVGLLGYGCKSTPAELALPGAKQPTAGCLWGVVVHNQLLGTAFVLQPNPYVPPRDVPVWMAPLDSSALTAALWQLDPSPDAGVGIYRMRNHAYPELVFDSSLTLVSEKKSDTGWLLELTDAEQELFTLRPERARGKSLDIGPIAPYPLLTTDGAGSPTQLWRITPYEYCDDAEAAASHAPGADAAVN